MLASELLARVRLRFAEASTSALWTDTNIYLVATDVLRDISTRQNIPLEMFPGIYPFKKFVTLSGWFLSPVTGFYEVLLPSDFIYPVIMKQDTDVILPLEYSQFEDAADDDDNTYYYILDGRIGMSKDPTSETTEFGYIRKHPDVTAGTSTVSAAGYNTTATTVPVASGTVFAAGQIVQNGTTLEYMEVVSVAATSIVVERDYPAKSGTGTAGTSGQVISVPDIFMRELTGHDDLVIAGVLARMYEIDKAYDESQAFAQTYINGMAQFLQNIYRREKGTLTWINKWTTQTW